VLLRRPGGRPRARVGARTEWGSPRVLSVVRERSGWLGVLAPELRNGEVAWLRASSATLAGVRWSLQVDLSRRRLAVRDGGRTVRELTVGVGGPGSPTPTGRFAVTDRLRVTGDSSPYGCCVLALTGHQTRLPPGWPGGDRLAVHGTAEVAGIGRAASLGCLRAPGRDARWLIETVPLGAPVFIRE